MLQYFVDGREPYSETINVTYRGSGNLLLTIVVRKPGKVAIAGFSPSITAKLHMARVPEAVALIKYFTDNPLPTDADTYTVRDILVMRFGIKHE